MEMNVVLLFTFILGVIELISGFVIQPFENVDYNTKDYIFGGDKELDLGGSTIHGNDVPTTTSITSTEVTIITTLTTSPDARLRTTTPSVLDDNVTTSNHNIPKTTTITPKEVTILTTLTTIPDERTNIPSIDIDDDDEYHNDCDCPPQFLNNVVKCTCTI